MRTGKNVMVNVFEARALTENELALDELWYESEGGKVVLHTAIDDDGVKYATNGMHFSVRLDEFSTFLEV